MNKLYNPVKNNQECEKVIKGTFQGVLCMVDNNAPYALPINHAYQDGKFYFHSAAVGRKLEVIQKNPCVTFLISKFYGDPADFQKSLRCHGCWESVIATGKARVISEKEELTATFKTFMAYYGEPDFEPGEDTFEKTKAILLEVESMTARREDKEGHTEYWVWEKEPSRP